jgi:hypothetical protein
MHGSSLLSRICGPNTMTKTLNSQGNPDEILLTGANGFLGWHTSEILRHSIERHEALDAGGIVMTNLEAGDVVRAVGEPLSHIARDALGAATVRDSYLVISMSDRVGRIILSPSDGTGSGVVRDE